LPWVRHNFFLRRIDCDAYGFKFAVSSERQKVVLNAIRLCLNHDEFRADVVKEALKKLLEDDPVVVTLMRTVILSYLAHSELKKFTLTEVIPSLIRKKVT
jgi:hypothetical protein